MKDRWLITIEIETYDGDPKTWDWGTLLGYEDKVTVMSSDFKGRVLKEDSNV